ncbi:endonuclease/exonuclease/phosphatase family protein [Brevundimonas sp.]|uniref:endonuclease/exonuclease/phosphatase family protein n=1 Tax=Brevundimonas sp. TaxID=1871086 RepID=UPI0035619875
MFWIVGGLILLAALPGLLNLNLAPLEMVANLRPQVAVAALVFGVAALTVGRLWTGGGAVVLGACLLLLTPELFARPSPPVTQPGLKLVWANVFKTDAVVERLAALAERTDADIVVLAEPPRDSARTREALAAWPFVHGPEDPSIHGTVVFSRRPISARTTGAVVEGGYPLTVVDVEGVRIIALHPPVAVTPRRLAGRNAMLRSAREAATGQSIVIGDMNATPWSRQLRLTASDLVRVSTGPGSTWFSSLPVLGLPIDQIFATPGLQASARVGPGIGSDHLPLLVSIAPE